MEQIEIRASGTLRASSPGHLVGYAAVFDSETRIADFTEVVRPGAFTKSLQDGSNVRCLYHHDGSALLGTRKAGTLKLSEDAHGLRFEVALPDTTTGRDLAALVGRGDITGASFGFRVREGGETWTERNAGEYLRELRDLELLEITVTPDPAYADSSVATRSLKRITDERNFNDFLNNPVVLWLESC